MNEGTERRTLGVRLDIDIVWFLYSAPVDHLLKTFLDGHVFHPIVTRDFKPPKPDPAGILHIAQELGLKDGGSSLIVSVSSIC